MTEERIETLEDITEKSTQETITITQSPEDKFISHAITSGKLLKHLGSIFKAHKFSFIGKFHIFFILRKRIARILEKRKPK
jgi:hypothetical protein